MTRIVIIVSIGLFAPPLAAPVGAEMCGTTGSSLERECDTDWSERSDTSSLSTGDPEESRRNELPSRAEVERFDRRERSVTGEGEIQLPPLRCEFVLQRDGSRIKVCS